jgi:hypothetical protein
MELFDRWFAKQYKKARDNMDRCKTGSNASVPMSTDECMSKEEILDGRQSYTLKMQPANGGTIIQVIHYDDNQRDWEKDLYVITDDKDLGQEIKSILVQYRLKHI